MLKKQVKSRNFSFGTIVALYKVIKKTLRNERRKTMERKLRNMSWTDFEELRKTAKTIIIPSAVFIRFENASVKHSSCHFNFVAQ